MDTTHEKCHRNWDGPSTSIEKDHYADGDFPMEKIYAWNRVPHYNRRQRLGCFSQIEDQRRLKIAARGAIIPSAEFGDIMALRHDLKNGPFHVFGVRMECKLYYCRKKIYQIWYNLSMNMDKPSPEDGENGTEEALPNETTSTRTTLTSQCCTTGIRFDVQTRTSTCGQPSIGLETISNATGYLISNRDTNRASTVTLIGTQYAVSSNEPDLSCETHTQEVISEEGRPLEDNYPCHVPACPPPSYETLAPPIPETGLASTVHTQPPPSYEQTFGLRYLDRDQPVVVFNTESMWGYRPQIAYCLQCNAMVLTSIQVEYCTVTHLSAVFLFLFCCWPCCVLPYFIPALKKVRHHCPACILHLGTYKPFYRHT